MLVPSKPLLPTAGVQLTNAVATAYTTPTSANVSTLLEQITVANTAAAPHTWSLWRVPLAGSAGDVNAIGKAITIAANTSYVIAGNWNLPQGWTLQVQADANSVITMQFDGKVFQ